MATTTTTPREATGTRSRVRTTLILLAATAIAIGANAVVAAVAMASGAPADFGPLTPPAFALFTVVGIALAWIGWTLVRRSARDPRRVLRVLVPVVTLVSLVPDVLLLAFRFIPGTNAVAAVSLMMMHLVVVAVAVPAFVLTSRRR